MDSATAAPKKKEKRSRKDLEREEEEDLEIVQDQNLECYKSTATTSETAASASAAIPEHLKLQSLKLSKSTLASLVERGVKQLFPIQAAAFAHVMAGKDLMARARTGTGKTLAFALPMVETLKQEREKDPKAFAKRGRGPRVLIMAPTRELAIQGTKALFFFYSSHQRINSNLLRNAIYCLFLWWCYV
jgi:ATP-dependent RNA helicase DDX21